MIGQAAKRSSPVQWMHAGLRSQCAAVRGQLSSVDAQPIGWLGGVCGYPKRAKVTLEWTGHLNPLIADSNRTVFETLMKTTGVGVGWDTDNNSLAFIEFVLASTITNGLSRSASSATAQGAVKGVFRRLLCWWLRAMVSRYPTQRPFRPWAHDLRTRTFQQRPSFQGKSSC